MSTEAITESSGTLVALAEAKPKPKAYAIATGLHLGEGPNRLEVFQCSQDVNCGTWFAPVKKRSHCPSCGAKHETVPLEDVLRYQLIGFTENFCIAISLERLMSAWMRFHQGKEKARG